MRPCKLWSLGGLLLALTVVPGTAQAWDLFRAENKDVKHGNELLERGKAEEATQAYEAAQRSLPNDPGVQLNKGLGLLGAGKLPEAREAFRAASQGTAGPELRGKANYNLGLTFLNEADALAKEEKLEEAQKLLTESVDAFKNSLRNAPKNRDAAWNLEIAKRRLVDLEQKKQKQDQEKKDQEKKDQEKKDQENQDQQKQDQQDPNQDPQKQDQQKQDESKDGSDKQKPEPKDGSDKQKPEEKDKAGQDQAKPPQPDKGSQDQAQEQPPPPNQKALPEHMQQALDALNESDDNLQKQRARARARQRPQRIEKDW